MTTATNIYMGGAATAPLGQRILRFPLTRIVLAIAFFMVPFLLIQGAATHFFDVKLYSRMGQLLGAVVGCLSYVLYVTKIEKRAVSELALKGALLCEIGRGIGNHDPCPSPNHRADGLDHRPPAVDPTALGGGGDHRELA